MNMDEFDKQHKKLTKLAIGVGSLIVLGYAVLWCGIAWVVWLLLKHVDVL